LVFGAKGDQSFILGDRASEKRKGDRSGLKNSKEIALSLQVHPKFPLQRVC
jgi:hypothetical protein